jgi:parallel beta-helix repeat protein
LNTLINNTCFNNSAGIGLISNSSIIRNNNCNNNRQYGIRLSGFQNKLINNTCSNNLFGINIWGSKNIVEHNNVSNNSYGLRLDDSANNNTVFNNIISYNTKSGLVTEVETKNNNIYHNKIIFNFKQIDIWTNPYQTNDNFNNFWNNSDHEGNFWSDYTGVDNGANGRTAGDGIGDTKIPHQDVDYYPFVNPDTKLDDDSGGDDNWLRINFNTCRTLSILLIILMIILFLILRKIFTQKKPNRK